MSNPNFRDLIANDSWAVTFQSLGQYRTALLDELDKTLSQTVTIDEKELIDLDTSLRVTANSLDHFGQCHVVPSDLLRRAAAFILKQDARIAELEAQSNQTYQDTRTDDGDDLIAKCKPLPEHLSEHYAPLPSNKDD